MSKNGEGILKVALERLASGQENERDREVVRQAIETEQITLAIGERAVAAGGSVNDAIIITGDGNEVVLFKGGEAQALRMALMGLISQEAGQRKEGPASVQPNGNGASMMSQSSTRASNAGHSISDPSGVLEKVNKLHSDLAKYKQLLMYGDSDQAETLRSELMALWGEIEPDITALGVPREWTAYGQTKPAYETALSVPVPGFLDFVKLSIDFARSSLEMAQGKLRRIITSQVPAIMLGGGQLQRSDNVFIVHGHDTGLREAVARFIEKLGLKAIVLAEQPNRGRTIVEKLESHNTAYAVVLLTPDDMGYPRENPDQVCPRARQNVILELGYFMGVLGRQNVCALYTGGVELPSDIYGVVYVPADSGWKLGLAKELKSAGFEVDLNKALG